jgi:hypothetical protein
MFFAVMAAPLEYVRPEFYDEAVDRHHTLPDDPHADADTPAVDSELRNSYLLFIFLRRAS